MKSIAWVLSCSVVVVCLLSGCSGGERQGHTAAPVAAAGDVLLDKYTTFRLEAELSHLSDGQKRMVGLLIDAAQLMDEGFWRQAYGDPAPLLAGIEDPALRRFAEINYGPWDRLADNAPFIPGVGEKPKGARFYPEDMTEQEFAAACAVSAEADKALKGLYTAVRRDAAGALTAVPYRSEYGAWLEPAAAKLREAAKLAQDPGFKTYLELRADALLSDSYRASDIAWMEMKDNPVDVVIGPVETYEDQLFGFKASFTGYVLLKDLDWSARLARYASMLPELQSGLPVPAEYKRETPGGDADLNAYDVVYYAGDCNAGSKTIAINLPNDEQVQLEKGTRRLQLKNAMRAKFDKILLPISEVLIAPDQRGHVTFDAFFANTMFHEVAHGLGIKNTLDGKSTVRQALEEQASGLEEGKADILGLYMVTALHDRGELGDAPLEDYYVTFLAGIFRSVRFGAASAHGRANMLRFNFFEEMGAFTTDDDGFYRADFARMKDAVAALSELILRLQGDGDHAGAAALMAEKGAIGPALQADLDRVDAAGIPVDIVFEQGRSVLGI